MIRSKIWLGLLSALGATGLALAQVRPFVVGGQTVALGRAETNANAYFRAFRPNHATGRWDVDVLVTNGTSQTLRTPLVLRFETARALAPGVVGATLDAEGKPFLNLTPLVPRGEFPPGAVLRTFTLSLGDAETRPELGPALYSRAEPVGSALVALRTLAADGVPVEDVVAEEIGISKSGRRVTGRGGWLTLAPRAGVRGWRLELPGHETVFRLVPAGSTHRVQELPSPRFVPVATEGATRFNASTLPAPVPAGWSPLAAAHFPAGTARLDLPEPIAAGAPALLVRWDSAGLVWRRVLVLESGAERTETGLSEPALLAVVQADASPLVPPVPAAAGALVGVAFTVDPADLRATGAVTPATRSASRDAGRVTAEVRVELTSTAGPLASGQTVPAEITEEYRLRNGTRRVLPAYTTVLVGYQRPAAMAGAVQARFALRPYQLLPGEELVEAVVRVQVLPPAAFAGGVLAEAGGTLGVGNLRLVASAGALTQPEAVLLRDTTPASATGIAPPGVELVRAFELSVGAVSNAAAWAIELGPQTPQAAFVLARAIYDAGRHGFQPVQRFASDATGGLRSLESAPDALPGLDGGGQYLLFRTAAGEALVPGIARDVNGQPVGGLSVRRGPWTAFTDAGGRFQLLAPAGATEVSVLDPRTGDTGTSVIEVGPSLTPVATALDAAPRGPRVASVSPANLATNVPRVTPVVVTFNRPLNPVTVVAGGVRLLDATNGVVPASVSLNLVGTVMTLLPTTPLAPGTAFRLAVAPTVTDLTARPVEGDREFRFATEDDSRLRTEVPLVIHEPLNGEAALVGGPGLAEPESPVILVNETTGFTATVLSKVDGSFSNSLPADVDDLLGAVIVNRNGTRNTVPAGRQLFRDGRVGLYQGGGVLTASQDGVSVAVTVPPGSVPNKTIFRLRPVSAADLAAVTAGTPPSGAVPLRGFQLETTGDPLREALRVSQPVNSAEITVLPGATPEQMAFALIRGVEIDGTPVYEVVDTARFVDGRLETEGELGGVREGLGSGESASAPNARSAQRAGIRRHSFAALPFHFLFVGMANVLKAQFSVVNGKVHSVETANGETVAGSRQPVAGAAVRVGGEVVNSVVSPGSLVALSTANGSFALPGNVGLVAQNIVVGSATSQRFPGQIALSRTTLLQDVQRLPLDLFFRRGGGALIADDRERPTISVSHAPASPPTNQIATLRVLANDDKQMAGVNVVTVSVTATDPDIAVSPADVTVTPDPGGTQSLQTIRRTYGVQSAKPLTANLLITAEDAAGRTNAVPYALTFGGPPPPPVLDPNDVTGPFVTRSTPTQGSEGVLPGQSIRLQLSEPLKPDFLNNPGAAFQLSPSAGNPVVALRDNDTAVELTWYRLAPGTAYHLTVVPILYDRNGNRLDQNPYNNSPSTTGLSADAFGLSFTTAPLTPATLPGVANGAGVAALGRQLLVLDRESASSGAIQIFDATDPARPSFVSRIALPAFPRAFTVIPQYAFRRTASGPMQTNDLVVAAGGTLGGEGQWLRVLAVQPNGTFQRLVTTTLSSSPAAAVGKFQWSAPLLGYLENDADTTMVGLVNLQLAILADNQTTAERAANPAGGKPGKDLNGDGDFVDAGEELPLPDGTLPRLGVINGGLVAAHVAPDPGFRLRDFDLKFGGNFLGAILSAPPSDGRSRYITFVTGGVPVTAAGATLELTPEAKRLFLLFGQELETLGGISSANLALVSQHAGGNTPPRLLVLDVTDPASPQVANEIRIPAAHGIPQSIRQREDGLLVLSTTADQLLLDPRKLRLVPLSLSDPHPALVGWVPGFGGGMMQFVHGADGVVASAVGGAAQVTGVPARLSLTLHHPGTFFAPGPAVADARKNQPQNTLVFVNGDFDALLVTTPAASPAHRPDFSRQPRSPLDNDLLALRISRLPQVLGGAVPTHLELRLGAAGTAEPVAQALDFLGVPIPATGTNGSTLVVRHALDNPSSPFRSLRAEAVTVFLEAVLPAADVQVTVEVFDSSGRSLGSDSVRFTPFKAAITSIWSEQFAGSRSNELPNNSGEVSEFIAMANDANGLTKVGARVTLEPDLPAVRDRLRGRLFVPHERSLIGASRWTGDEIHVEAQDDRVFPRGFPLLPLLFSSQLDTPLDVEEILLVGFDHDGDSILTEAELPVGFGAFVQSGRLALPEVDARFGVSPPHFKVFPRSLYEREDQLALVVAAEVSGYMGLGGSAANLLSEALGIELPVTLIGGVDPVSVVLPIASVRLANFFSGSAEIGNPFIWPDSVDEYDWPDAQSIPYVGHQTMAHQTGVFTRGFRRLKRLNHGPAHFISRTIAESRSFENAVVGIVAIRQAVKDAIRQELGAEADFAVSLSLSRPTASKGIENDIMSVGFKHQIALKDIDLEYGIGNASIPQLDLEIEGERKVLSDGRAGVRVTRVRFRAVVEDIYDWDWNVNPFGVILEAGHGVYGTRAGAPFIHRFEVEGEVTGLDTDPIDVAL
jgi:hypothetical protein